MKNQVWNTWAVDLSRTMPQGQLLKSYYPTDVNRFFRKCGLVACSPTNLILCLFDPNNGDLITEYLVEVETRGWAQRDASACSFTFMTQHCQSGTVPGQSRDQHSKERLLSVIKSGIKLMSSTGYRMQKKKKKINLREMKGVGICLLVSSA